MKKTNFLILTKSWQHHSRKSGYGGVFRDFESDLINFYYLNGEQILGPLRKFLILVFIKILRKRNIFNTIEKLYLTCLIVIKKINYIHFTAMEDLFFDLNAKIDLRKIFTIHIPIEQLQLYPYFWDRIKKNDALICVSKSQKNFLEKYVKIIEFIPHSIDIEYYTQKQDLSKKYNSGLFNCITCGVHLRDYVTLSKIIKKCYSLNQEIRFRIIYPKNMFNPVILDFFNDLSEYKNVTIYIGIDDLQLKELYSSSHLLVLPLYNGTANNSILEATAMSLPIVTTDLEGTKDYLNDSFTTFIEKDNIDGYINAIFSLFKDPNKCVMQAINANDFCKQNFANEIIKSKLITFYEKLVKTD